MSHRILRPFFILILLIGLVVAEAPPAVRAAGPWYVSTTGDDSNDCLSSTSPCMTINGAIAKASSGDTIYVAEGRYTGGGDEVVLINQDITLSGGWDTAFTTQIGMSTVDGEDTRRGIILNSSVPVVIENFIIQNGFSGIGSGGGILNNGGTMIIRNTAIINNKAGDLCCFGGNGGGGIMNFGGTIHLHNSTVSTNTIIGGFLGSGILNYGSLSINNSTITNNTNHFGIMNASGSAVFIQNSIVAGNSGRGNPLDCSGPIDSAGFNLIGSSLGCSFTPATGDLFDVDPLLADLLPSQGYHPLLPSSPAIDAGNPAGCTDQDGNLLNTDQRGVARPQGTACDIGAYEFATPGPAVSLSVVDGSGQRTATLVTFPRLLKVAALDNQGSPVSGIPLIFTAPASDASGTFADTNNNITSAATDEGGVATSSVFTANDQAGAYSVTASASGLGSVEFNLEQFDRPAHDNFADALALPSLPITANYDITFTGIEPGEPQGCFTMDKTIWYSFMTTETTRVRVDTQGSDINANVNFYAAGAGLTDLQFLGCAGPGSSADFLAEAGQTYYLQAGPAAFGESGAVQVNLTAMPTITGRVTDAPTGAPLPGNMPPFTFVTLQRICGDGCLEFVSSQSADSEGRFVFDNHFGSPLPMGSYQIDVSANLFQTRQFGPFEFSGADLDVGDLPLDPSSLIGSIRGRLVDAATGKPLSQAFPSSVELLRCTDGNCFESVSLRIPDSRGTFRFETDNIGNPLPAGTYQIRVIADQYHNYQTEPFDVGEGMHRTLGNLRITSFPVRFSEIQPCADLPASGGACVFSVRIWNGLNTRLKGHTWSWVSAQLPDSFISFSNFQVKAPQKLELDKGKSRIVRFRFSVPGSSSQFPAFICPNIVVGQGNNSLLNPVGFKDLFCVFRNTAGFSIAPPQDGAEVVPADVTLTSLATETEPNNSCQTAQDVGAIPPTLVVEGNLDSTLEPDIDFYRFSGTPGAPIIIDYEGQATGKGTLDNPLLALFDSDCNLVTLTDDSDTANSRLEIPVPADGSFILGATAHPDFGLTGGGNGSYQLTVTPVPLIGSIRGRITNFSGAPLRGDVEPFAVVYLLRCSDFGCAFVNSQATNSEGRFLFESDNNGILLSPGSYQVVASANQYLEGHVEPFIVGEAEDYDVGDLALASFPVVFSNIRPCSLPADGGICNFSVKITNGLSTRFSGKAWSMVNATDLGSFINFTNFQTGTPRDVKLGPGKSTTIRFQFRVRDSVADGATICPVIYVGKNPNAFFHPEGVSLLFCVTKGAGGLTLLSAQEAQAASQQMQIQNLAPPDLFINKEK